jgi:hypothetical protein
MTLNPQWKMGLGLAGIFVLGAIGGSLVTLKATQMALRRAANPDHWEALVMKRLSKRLDLTSVQQAQIQPLVAQATQEVRVLRAEMVAKASSSIRSVREKIEPLLTPAQRQEMEKAAQERQQKLQHYFPPLGSIDK